MNIKNRITRLEMTRRIANRAPRVILLRDGAYSEGGRVLSAEEYADILSDPANDVTLIRMEYDGEDATSHITNGGYSVTVGIDMTQI